MAKKVSHFWIDPDELSRKGIDYCSHEAQWLWLKVMRILHASERYGYLTRDGKAVSDEQAARRCGIDVTTWIALRDELLEFDLLKQSGDGILYSPELVAQAEWRSSNAKRQKDFQNNKRKQKYNGTNNAEYNGEYNEDITDDITPLSRPNSNINVPPFSSSNEKEKGGGGASQPAAADFSANNKETLQDYLLRKQLEYPNHDVQKVYADFKAKCGSAQYPKLKNTQRHFDKWIAEQDIELPSDSGNSGFAEVRRAAIDGCNLCDKNGYRRIGDGVQVCRHKPEKAEGAAI